MSATTDTAVRPRPTVNGTTPRTALITGGSRGIGEATARELAAQGLRVALHCRNSAEQAESIAAEIRADGGTARVLVGDVADSAAAEQAFSAIEQDWGPVAVLVNNAGITADGLAPRMADESWDAVIETNLSGAFRMTRRALGPMMRARWGRIVNVGSIVGRRANAGRPTTPRRRPASRR